MQRDKGKGNGGRCGRQHVGVGSSVLIKIDRVSPNLRSPAKTSFRMRKYLEPTDPHAIHVKSASTSTRDEYQEKDQDLLCNSNLLK